MHNYFSVLGEVLTIIDTHQMNNSFASISPCGKFVASAGVYESFICDSQLFIRC